MKKEAFSGFPRVQRLSKPPKLHEKTNPGELNKSKADMNESFSSQSSRHVRNSK